MNEWQPSENSAVGTYPFRKSAAKSWLLPVAKGNYEPSIRSP